MKSKLYKTKRVALEDYTSLELGYLLLDILKEITKRKKAVPKLMDELNRKTYDLTHEIEFGQLETRKQKADHYEVMEKHFDDRRLAKREYIVVNEVLSELDFSPEKVTSKLGQAIKKKQAYFKLADGDRVITPKKWAEFNKEHMSVYK